MANNVPRKHHFVQAAHLANFTNEDGILHVYAKDGARFHGTPHSLFRQTDLNSYATDAGLDTSFEAFITDVENMTMPAVSRIIASERLDAEDMVEVTAYLALSAMRNPTVQAGITEQHRQLAELHTRLMDRRDAFAHLGPFPLGEGKTLSQLLDEGTVGFNINNSVYLASLTDLMKAIHRPLALGYGWSLLKSHRERVVIGDHPLTIVHPGLSYGPYGIPPGGTGAEAAFPLSRGLYLVGSWGEQLPDSDAENAVDELNKRQAMHASRQIATGHDRRSFHELAVRYRSVSFQTKVETVDTGSDGVQFVRRGVFSVPGTVERKRPFSLGAEVVAIRTLL